MYAIIATGGKQYKVSEGDIIDIEKIEGENGTEVTFDKVICIGGDTMKVGADVAAATVTGTVMDQGKGKKVVVYHYKRKSGYHKKNGHRQAYTRVKIDSIQDQLCRKYDALQKKADPFLSIEAEHMLGKGIRYLRYLIRGYAPRKITGYIRFGTGSPDLTGELTGLLYVLLPEAGTGYDIEPDFYELVLDTDTLATGQIRAYRLIWVGIRLILDKEFRTLLRQIRGKDKNKTSHRGPGGLRKKAASQLAKSGVEEAA